MTMLVPELRQRPRGASDRRCSCSEVDPCRSFTPHGRTLESGAVTPISNRLMHWARYATGPFIAVMMLAASLLTFACGPAGPSEEDVLASLTDLVIIPGYRMVIAEAKNLREAAESLCSMPTSATLANVRQSWRDMRAPWLRSQATWFGPVMDRRSVGLIDWPLTEPKRIESMLNERPDLSEDDVRYSLASSQRGLGAVEYLIFGEDAFNQLSSDVTRCRYVVLLSRVIETESQAILYEWTVEREEGGAYSGFFTGRAANSLITNSAVAELVRTQVFLVRTIVDMRLASALGLREGGADLTQIPGGLGANSLADLRNQVLGLRDVYQAHDSDGALGISHIVSRQSKSTDDRMRAHFAAVTSALDIIEGPLSAAIMARPNEVRTVYDRLSELQVTLNTEVVSQLAVAVGFSDTDGDSLR